MFFVNWPFLRPGSFFFFFNLTFSDLFKESVTSVGHVVLLQFCASCERLNQQRAAVWFHVSWLISAPYRFNTSTSLKYCKVVTVPHLFSKQTHLLTGSFTHLMCWMTVSNWIVKHVINVCWSEHWRGSQQFRVKSVYLSQEAVKHNMSALFWLISQTFSASKTCTYLNVIYCVRVMIIKTQLLYFSQRNYLFI